MILERTSLLLPGASLLLWACLVPDPSACFSLPDGTQVHQDGRPCEGAPQLSFTPRRIVSTAPPALLVGAQNFAFSTQVKITLGGTSFLAESMDFHTLRIDPSLMPSPLPLGMIQLSVENQPPDGGIATGQIEVYARRALSFMKGMDQTVSATLLSRPIALPDPVQGTNVTFLYDRGVAGVGYGKILKTFVCPLSGIGSGSLGVAAIGADLIWSESGADDHFNYGKTAPMSACPAGFVSRTFVVPFPGAMKPPKNPILLAAALAVGMDDPYVTVLAEGQIEVDRIYGYPVLENQTVMRRAPLRSAIAAVAAFAPTPGKATLYLATQDGLSSGKISLCTYSLAADSPPTCEEVAGDLLDGRAAIGDLDGDQFPELLTVDDKGLSVSRIDEPTGTRQMKRLLLADGTAAPGADRVAAGVMEKDPLPSIFLSRGTQGTTTITPLRNTSAP